MSIAQDGSLVISLQSLIGVCTRTQPHPVAHDVHLLIHCLSFPPVAAPRRFIENYRPLAS